MTGYNYHVLSIGTSYPLDRLGLHDRERGRDEFRLQISDQDRDVGRLRLVAYKGRWVHPTEKIVRLLDDYWNRGGAKQIVKRPMIHETGGACFARLNVLQYEARIGPLDSSESRVFLFDDEGGCVGHFPLTDLPGVRKVLSDVWNNYQTNQQERTMQLTIESNPKKLRDQARTLGIDPKGLKIGDLRKVVQQKIDESNGDADEEAPAPKAASPKKGGGKKKAPPRATKTASEDRPAVDPKLIEAVSAHAEKLSLQDAQIELLKKSVAEMTELVDTLQESLDEHIIKVAKLYPHVDDGDDEAGDEDDGPIVVADKHHDLLEDCIEFNDDGVACLAYETMDIDSLNLKQIEAIRETLEFEWDSDKIKGIRQKRAALREFQARMLKGSVEALDLIEGPSGEKAKATTPDGLAVGDRVWIADIENVWYSATITTHAESTAEDIYLVDEDGDAHVTVKCDDGEVANVYFLPEGEADPRFIGSIVE